MKYKNETEENLRYRVKGKGGDKHAWHTLKVGEVVDLDELHGQRLKLTPLGDDKKVPENESPSEETSNNEEKPLTKKQKKVLEKAEKEKAKLAEKEKPKEEE